MKSSFKIYCVLVGLSIGLVVVGWRNHLLSHEVALLPGRLDALETSPPPTSTVQAPSSAQPSALPAVPPEGESVATDTEFAPRAGGPVTPPSGASVVDGPDTKLVGKARALLSSPAGEERREAWVKLLAGATYFELVRMTEVVSQPPASKKLDDDRRGLRRLAIQQLAAHGELETFLTAREAFEWQRSSNALEIAYEELARKDPAAALKKWTLRESQLPDSGPAGQNFISALVAGLTGGDLEKSAESIRNWPPKLRSRVEAELERTKDHQN